MPLTVGGGIGSLGDIGTLLRAGADKVSLNTAALERPALIDEAARAFGSQCIVVAIDALRGAAEGEAALAGRGAAEGEPSAYKRDAPGGVSTWQVYTHGGRRPAGRDAGEWGRAGGGLGAGERPLPPTGRDGPAAGHDAG